MLVIKRTNYIQAFTPYSIDYLLVEDILPVRHSDCYLQCEQVQNFKKGSV